MSVLSLLFTYKMLIYGETIHAIVPG